MPDDTSVSLSGAVQRDSQEEREGRTKPPCEEYTAGCPAVSGPSGGGGSFGSSNLGPATSSVDLLLAAKPSTVSHLLFNPPDSAPEEVVVKRGPRELLLEGEGEVSRRSEEGGTSSEFLADGARLSGGSEKKTWPPRSSDSRWRIGVPGALGNGLGFVLLTGERGLGDGGRVWGDMTNLQKLAIDRKQYLAGVVIEYRGRTWQTSAEGEDRRTRFSKTRSRKGQTEEAYHPRPASGPA